METDRIYILGAGAVGMALAVHLANAGRQVVAVRTSADDVEAQAVEITIHGPGGRIFKSPVETVSLARLQSLAGMVAVTAKSYANPRIAARLTQMEVRGPAVILQNGIGVEEPYLGLDGLPVYRGVLYVTGQMDGERSYTFRPVTASPIGVMRGDEQELARVVGRLHTAEFPFVSLGNIQQEVWKKTTINSVFNSICPLLEVDNGIFVRDEETARLARAVVEECLAVMQRLGFDVSAEAVMQQLFTISRGSDGQLISTLQDINHGRETEIDYLNLAIARVAAALAPELKVSTTRALGEMVKIKARLRRSGAGLFQSRVPPSS